MTTDQDALYEALSPRAQKCWDNSSSIMIDEFHGIAEEEGVEFAVEFIEEWAEYESSD